MVNHYNYSIFQLFIERYVSDGFRKIDREDPLVIEMEEILDNNNQFFYVADLLSLQIRFISKGSKRIIGVAPEDFDLSTFISRTHPDEQVRYGLSRTKIIKIGQEIFINQKGTLILSSHFRQLTNLGEYFNLLFQAYLFYSDTPYKTVYILLVLTDISKIKINKHGHHFYLGDDPAFFRYPDAAFLKTGHIFSDREFEILQQIAAGFDSEQIANKLSLSVNTVNTHRRNMLKKTKKSTTHELVIHLQERGIL